MSNFSTIEVHQALHGYVDGHRQIALSKPLAQKDQRMLLALSDISGAGARLPDDGYLTGYPLPESGVYALARTWPAFEMSRPGCVWTHTLLIEFSDLASFASLNALLVAFKKRPSVGSAENYGRPLRIGSNTTWRASPEHMSWLACVLGALYDAPERKIVGIRPPGDADDLVVGIWSQQWPRLRRTFRFCTLSAADRSTQGSPFDLQLITSTERSARSKFQDSFFVDGLTDESPQWLDTAIEDLASPDASGLRSSLKILGSEATDGRRSFAYLCRLHEALKSASMDTRHLDGAILEVEKMSSSHAKFARGLVASACIERLPSLGSTSFEFLWKNLSTLDTETLQQNARQIGEIAWFRHPDLVASRSEVEQDLVFLAGVEKLGSDDLISGLAINSELESSVLSARPDLFVEPRFWKISSYRGAIAAAQEAGDNVEVMTSIIVSHRDDLRESALLTFSQDVVLPAVERAFMAKAGDVSTWLKAAVKNEQVVASYLLGKAIGAPFLCRLTHYVAPDFVRSDECDPWLIAFERAEGKLTRDDSTRVNFYLVARAMGRATKAVGKLMRRGLDGCYLALRSGTASSGDWLLVDHRLSMPIFWFSWDKAQRLSIGVADALVSHHVPPEDFIQLVSEGKDFRAIVESLLERPGGKAYLKHALKQLDSRNKEKLVGARLKLITEAL